MSLSHEDVRSIVIEEPEPTGLTEPVVTEIPTTIQPTPGDIEKYTVRDLMDVSQSVFNVKPEVVLGAFRHAGVTEATRTEARRLIQEFLSFEVPIPEPAQVNQAMRTAQRNRPRSVGVRW